MPHLTTIKWATRTVLSLVVEFTESYPNKPPSVRFTSKMFHPNGTAFTFEPFRSRIHRSSLCWRWYLSGYSSESLVTHIRRLGYSHIYSSKGSRRTKTWDRSFFRYFSRCWMSRMSHRLQIRKQRISIRPIDVNMRSALRWLWNKAGPLNPRSPPIFEQHRKRTCFVEINNSLQWNDDQQGSFISNKIQT